MNLRFRKLKSNFIIDEIFIFNIYFTAKIIKYLGYFEKADVLYCKIFTEKLKIFYMQKKRYM